MINKVRGLLKTLNEMSVTGVACMAMLVAILALMVVLTN